MVVAGLLQRVQSEWARLRRAANQSGVRGACVPIMRGIISNDMGRISAPAFLRKDLGRFFDSVAPFVVPTSPDPPATRPPIPITKEALATAFTRLENPLFEHRKVCLLKRRQKAPDFSVFAFIRPNENILSDILRFLIDPEGSHGQGGVFLHSLLEFVRPGMTFTDARVILAREAPTYLLTGQASKRRIDLLVSMLDFTLGIENKKFTGEGWQQIHDYCEHLRLAVKDAFVLIFLTRSGYEATSISPRLRAEYQAKGQLVSWSWEKDIPAWIDRCLERCEAENVKHFLSDFKRYIGSYLSKNQPEPEDNEQ